jgi:hypothetical protein
MVSSQGKRASDGGGRQMTDSRVTQETGLVLGSDTSDRRVTQVAGLALGSDTSDRRISQVVVLVLGSKPTGNDHWGWGEPASTGSWHFMEE